MQTDPSPSQEADEKTTLVARYMKPELWWLRLCFISVLNVSLLLAFILIVIYRPPTPKCMIYEVTGLACAGCGGTRMVFALLRGDILSALKYNPVTLTLLPFAFYGYLSWCFWFITKRKAWGTALLIRSVVGIAIFSIIFMVLRNLPFWPFSLVWPHYQW